VSLARNEISNEVEAYIKNEDPVQTLNGSIRLDAAESATITATSQAASLSAAIAATTGIALSGAGADSKNVILTKTNAYVENSALQSSVNVNLSATNAAAITATVKTGSLAAGVGGTTGVGASIGVSLARNLIGWDLDDNRVPAEVQAYIKESSVDAGGELTLSAVNSATINAEVLTGSVAIAAAGTTGVGLSGSGASAENKVATYVKAFIDGDGTSGIAADSVALTARDISIIDSEAGAASLAASFAGTAAVSLSIGVSLANNEISNEVEACIKNADSGVTTRIGGVSLTAAEAAVIASTSEAVSASAAIAGTAGIALSGAGAEATNVILTKTNAYVAYSRLVSAGDAGDVVLSATNTAVIAATILTGSLAVGVGGTAGVGASIGVSLAQNLIGWDSDDNRVPAEVQAYIKSYSINAAGDLILTATNAGIINAEVLAGSAAIAAAGTVGVGLSGAGASAENRVATYVRAFIDGDGATGIVADSVTLTAQDTSIIDSEAGAASLAASFAGTAAVSLSIGVALAENVISNEVEAFITNADNGVTSGDITLTAAEAAVIVSTSEAASASAAIAGTAGIALSGAGAESTNVILTRTNAYVKNSKLVSAGDVALLATNTAVISATIITGSAAVGGGGAVGVGASIGVSLARNLIGCSPGEVPYDYTTDSDPSQLKYGDRVLLDKGIRTGDVYKYIGPALSEPGDDIELSKQDYSDPDLWRQVNLVTSRTQVQAYVEDASIVADGMLTLTALGNQTIESVVLAGSVAISAGYVGVGISGAGVATENRIETQIRAYIDGDGATGITADSISLTADDTSTITAVSGAASVAASFGVAGASVSISAAVALNNISNIVEAFIKDADTGVTARFGGVSVTATESASITSVTTAASAAVTIALGGSFSGAGALALNSLANDVSAYIQDSHTVSATGAVTVAAEDTATVSATIATISLAGGIVGISVAASVADNRIGDNVTAYIDLSSVTATGGDISVTSKATPTITTTSAVSALSASIGIAGAGAYAKTTITGTTQAYLNGATLTADDHSVLVDATSTATADPSIIGGSAGLVSVAVMISQTTIGGTTRAYAGGETSVTADRLEVHSSDESTATPSTLVVGVGGVTGAGAKATSTVSRTTESYVGAGADISLGDGTLDVNATSQSMSEAKATGVGVGAISVALLFVDSTTNSTTRAFVGDGATVNAGQLNLLADATSLAKTPSKVVGVGLLAGAGIVLTATDISTVEAYIGPETGTETGAATDDDVTQITIIGGGVNVTAVSHSTADAQTSVISVGLVGVAGSKAKSLSDTTTQVYLGDRAEIKALTGTVTFETDATAISNAKGTGLTAGAIAVSFTDIEAEANANVHAFTESGGLILGNTVNILSNSDLDVDVNADGTVGGAIAVGFMDPRATVVSQNSASIGENTEITATQNFTLRATSDSDTDAVGTGTAGGAIAVVEATTILEAVSYTHLTLPTKA